MAALTDQQRAYVNGAFQMRSFRDMWSIIDQTYGQLGLGADMTDADRIAEYRYINEQLRKYIGSKQDQVLGHGADLDGMMAEVAELVSKGTEYGDERKVLVYNFLRDQWLIELYNAIQYAKDPEAYMPSETEE
jgi:hypothetical protein